MLGAIQTNVSEMAGLGCPADREKAPPTDDSRARLSPMLGRGRKGPPPRRPLPPLRRMGRGLGAAGGLGRGGRLGGCMGGLVGGGGAGWMGVGRLTTPTRHRRWDFKGSRIALGPWGG